MDVGDCEGEARLVGEDGTGAVKIKFEGYHSKSLH